MGVNVPIYLSDSALGKLDAEVERRRAADAERGIGGGRKAASRSSVVEELVQSGIEGGTLDRATIRHYAVSLGREYGAKKVSLFGSYARGDATADSDVDILLDKGAICGMRVLDFQDDLSHAIGRPVDVVTTAGASERFLAKISRDKVVLYEPR